MKLASARTPASSEATAMPRLNAQNCRLNARERRSAGTTSTIAATNAGLGIEWTTPISAASTAISSQVSG